MRQHSGRTEIASASWDRPYVHLHLRIQLRM